MPTIELTNRVNSDDSEAEVRARVLRFLASRGYRATPDPNEFKRGSLFGSLTGFTPWYRGADPEQTDLGPRHCLWLLAVRRSLDRLCRLPRTQTTGRSL